MRAPSLVFGDLYDCRYRFDRYWHQLAEVDVPTPITEVFDLSPSGDGRFPDAPTGDILRFMRENNLQQAFIRSGYKAATDRFRDGSIISQRDAEAVETTVRNLLAQHEHNDVPHGGILVVRERLDLDYCMEPGHSHSPEIRFFVEDGEVLSQTPLPGNWEAVPECSVRYSFIEERLSDIESPRGLAEQVAEEFAGTEWPWSVDAVLDAHGQWWITEMHIDGVYYNERRDDWWNICGHADAEPWSPLWMHGAAIREVSPDGEDVRG